MYNNSFLKARFEHIADKTCLTYRAFSAPLKITKTFYEPNSPSIILYMMDASPGMMEGDCYSIELDVQPHSHALVTNQAATKIHPAKTTGSSLKQSITVGSNAILEYFPEPTILFADSKLCSQTTIHLEQSSTLCMAEILTCGRVERDEKFKFQRFSIQTEIYYDGRLIAYESSQFSPSLHHAQSIGIYESFTHQATFWLISAKLTVTIVDSIKQQLNAVNSNRILISVSQFEPYAMAVRILGYTVWEIQLMIQQIWTTVRTNLLYLSPFAFRK